jgi:hypothetical protein
MQMVEEARKLPDNGWQVLLFKDGLGQYDALAVKKGEDVSAALRAWAEHSPVELPGESVEDLADRLLFDGPHRYCAADAHGEGAVPAVAAGGATKGQGRVSRESHTIKPRRAGPSPRSTGRSSSTPPRRRPPGPGR